MIEIFLGLGGIGAIGIFGAFHKPDLSREQLPRYINEESEFVTLPNGASMHYRDEGNPDGQVLVMVHGGFGSLQNWDGWVEWLKDDYRLISMDLLGHGLTGAYPENIYTRISERDAIHALLQKLGVDQYTVAGNSFGGGIALEIALEYPDEVVGLILVDSEGIPNSEDGYDVSMFTDDELTTPDDPAYTQLTWLEKFGSKFIGPAVVRSTLDSMIYNKELLTRDFVDYFGRVLRYTGNRESQILMFRQGLYLISTNGPQDLLPRLTEIQCPTLVMHGEQDTLVPLRVAQAFHGNITDTDLAIISEAGHMPMIEKPQETAQTVRDFFQRHTNKTET